MGLVAHNVLSLLSGALNATTLHVLVVVFVATLIRSAFGFGEALFAVPLLVLRLPLETAAPLAVLISITIAAIVVAQDWRKIHVRTMGWLTFATVFGIPLGLLLLTSSHQRFAKGMMGIVIIAFAVYSLIGDNPPELKTDSMPWLLGCGFFAGVLGGAYGMNGPPLAIYGVMRRWSAKQFRATLQGYFLPASLLGMAGYWWKGLWVPAVSHYYLLSLPAMLPAILLGKVVNHCLHGEAFLKYIYAGLAAIGAVLLLQACAKG
ncbi:MAG: sulfite exporter TauE/SafE family protein [Candidatus Korobacteraceae bacterium]